VRRAVFRQCLRLYQEARCGVSERNSIYCADFWLAFKRTLPANELRAAEAWFLECCDHHQVEPLLHLGRGAFFHWVYRVEARVGEALLERGVFPFGVYFARGAHEVRYRVGAFDPHFRSGAVLPFATDWGSTPPLPAWRQPLARAA
jgi:hypothetical protein